MIIFPAMDLRGGSCVRLFQGEFSTSQVVGEDPVSVAQGFKAAGAEYIHMVDLDGALEGEIKNGEIAKRVMDKTGLPVQLGGGIRGLRAIEELVKYGAARVILGTAALGNPELVTRAAREFGDKIAVGIDAREGFVAVEGWLKTTRINYLDFGKKMEDIGVKTIIFTDISRDGTLRGPNINATSILKDNVSCNIIASGGVKDIGDIKRLRDEGIYGAIIGKALYNGNIDLKEAIEVGRGA